MKLNKREEFLLWKLLEFNLHRYLIVLKRSGYERAEIHIEIAKIIWEIRNLKTVTGRNHEEYMKIHDEIADKITNDLDKTIGLDLNSDPAEWEYDLLTDKFFKAIVKII